MCEFFEMDDKSLKSPVIDMIPVTTKITEHKLNGSNFMAWSKTVRVYLRSIEKEDHLTDDPPNDNTRQVWLRDDARIFLQLRNSIDSEIINLVDHCEYVKELVGYLEFLYSGKGNISRIYEVCKGFYLAEQQEQTLTAYLMSFKKTYKELNALLPFSPDVKVQQTQREQMAVMSFLAGLRPEFDAVKSQILSSPEISSLQQTFNRILHTENQLFVAPSHPTSALVSQNTTRSSIYRKGGDNIRGQHSGEVVCYYCHEPGHTKRTCKKLQNRNPRKPFAHIASNNFSSSSEKTITVSADEFAKFTQY